MRELGNIKSEFYPSGNMKRQFQYRSLARFVKDLAISNILAQFQRLSMKPLHFRIQLIAAGES